MKQDRLLKVIQAPHMSEKAALGAENQSMYVFKVATTSTKPEIKEAVELLFKTKVAYVRIVNVKTKPKRFGAIQGRSKAWKKAYVTLQEGQRIDFAGGQP
ncbi:MAG: 50S ribosomal protein L23 [Gammaproteobacteria bacterium]